MEWIPKHDCGMFLSHNENRSSYMSVAKWIDTLGIEDDEWVSIEEKAKAVATESVWCLQWYPDTPVGFYRVFASSVEAIRAYCLELRGKV